MRTAKSLGRAQDTDVAASEDRAECRLLRLGFELPHQDGAHLRFLPAPVDVGHDPIHGDLHPQLRTSVARRQCLPHRLSLVCLALSLPAS